MRTTERDLLLPVLGALDIPPLDWAVEVRRKASDVVSRLYVFAPQIRACITLCHGEKPYVIVNNLGRNAEETVAWLDRYVGRCFLNNF